MVSGWFVSHPLLVTAAFLRFLLPLLDSSPVKIRQEIGPRREEEIQQFSCCSSAVCVGTCSTSKLNWCLMTAVFNCTTKAEKLPSNCEWTDSLDPEGFLDKNLTSHVQFFPFFIFFISLSDPVDRQTNRMVEVVISCLVILLPCSTNAKKRLCTEHLVRLPSPAKCSSNIL